ncbi:MAG: YIP1 family protein [Methanomicrobiaceae archaeon]|uniref:Yip1 domain-containing protein n=1 Tax=hydrocarbon metagenome TaxID=938273 RepID=A0A0W8FG22_9ZZZZ|nr:YIP1 family protein [Methanomicrobiaceae archaeon]MDD5420275.1 YIP1 family protein [Methanomicrobiaceae archaeon]
MSLSIEEEFFPIFRGMITEPQKTIRKSRSASLGDAITYFVIVLVIYGVLTAVFTGILGQVIPFFFPAVEDLFSAAFFLVGLVISGVIGLFLLGAILHIFIKIAGGSGGYTETMRAFALAGTPLAVIGWIPVLGLLSWLWTLVLVVLGAREYHKLSVIRAVIAIFLPFILLALLGIAAALLFMIDPGQVTISEIVSFTG